MRNLETSLVLKNTEFLKLWGNQLLLQVGLNMCNYTALLIIADRTHSVFAQAQFFAALTLPAFAVGLIAGPLVDTVDRKRIMLVANLILAILFLAYIFANGIIFLIMLIAFFTSIAARFFIPAEIATIPLIVEKKILDQANAIFLFTLMGSVLLGYFITGPIMQTFGGLGTKGEITPFFIGSLILFIGFFLILKLKKVGFAKPELPEMSFIKKALYLSLQAIKEVKRNNRISLPMLLLVFVELIIGVLSVSLLEYVRQYLHLPLTSVSIVLITPLIIGLAVGALVLREVKKNYGVRLSTYLSCIGIGILFLVLGTIPLVPETWISIMLSRIATIVSAFIFGVLIVFVSVQSRTVLQTHARIQMQGRIFSFLDILIALSIPLPVLVLGFFADKISILPTLIFMGMLIILATYIGNKMVFGKISR